jgi:hypothetical protein
MALLKFMNFYIIAPTLIAIYSVLRCPKFDRLGKLVTIVIIFGGVRFAIGNLEIGLDKNHEIRIYKACLKSAKGSGTIILTTTT